MDKKNTKITTGMVRLSYAHIWEPQKSEDGKENYSASLIIPKSDKKTLKLIEEAIDNAIENGKDKIGTASKNRLQLPLRDGDEERDDDPVYADAYFINARSQKQPIIVDRRVQPIIDQDEVYSGCYVNASISFFAYNFQGKKGVGVALNAIQKVKDGDVLGGGRISAESEFSSLDDDDDDMLD